jgi:hypothetical protein
VIGQLADVIFWLCCAAALMLLAAYMNEWPGQTLFHGIETVLLIGAAIVFVFGLAVRYVIKG